MEYKYNQQEMTKKSFDFIYGCAMRDAILQKSFIGEKTWVGKVENPKVILNEYINKVLHNEFSTQESHDTFFLETANNICKEINAKRPQGIKTDTFSFGNAQKLINIAVKHIYTFCYDTPSLREGFRYCHCPLDGIILEKVWSKAKDKINLGKKGDFCKSWGAEGTKENKQPVLSAFPARYQLFQEAIRKLIGCGDIFPIEFDYLEWNK